MKEKISVVIPTWNEEKNIGKCIYYLLKQTIKPYEIIIVDKFSKDKTATIAKKLGVKVILSKANIPKARKIGIKNASGDWIFLTDADTFLIDEKWFERALYLAKKKKTCFVVGMIKPIGNFSEKLIIFIWNFLQSFLTFITPKTFFAIPSGFFVKKEVIEKIAFPKNTIFEDVKIGSAISKFCKPQRCFLCYSITSLRRMRKMGYLNFCLFWICQFIKVFILKKEKNRRYEAIRL